ncbi:MAG TPA: hypothetical protein VEK76_02310 [Candidatus Binatia bacterium]|nr:hypothetical protein [Candidatus Binatia bacterium]
MQTQAAPPVAGLPAAPRRALNRSAAVCAGVAGLAVVVTAVSRQPTVGVALALGLLLGAGNGFAAAQLLRLGAAFAATSILRLLTLTLLAVAAGFVLGWRQMVLVAGGMAFAQLALTATSLREVLRAP